MGHVQESKKERGLIVERIKRSGYNSMVAQHWHDRYEIYYLMEGERYYFVHNESHQVSPGDLVFVDRFALHKTADAGLPHHERILIEFAKDTLFPAGEQLEEVLDNLFSGGGGVLSLKQQERVEIEEMLVAMVEETILRKQRWELQVQSMLMQLLVKLDRIARPGRRNTFAPQSAKQEKMTEVMRYLGAYYTQAITLRDLAERFNTSPYHLSRQFKAATGFTLIEYVHMIRVGEAQRLLRETGDKVIDIAERTGFDSVVHFGRIFKRHARCTPLQYRKKTRM